jgi:hypothetical protein
MVGFPFVDINLQIKKQTIYKQIYHINQNDKKHEINVSTEPNHQSTYNKKTIFTNRQIDVVFIFNIIIV